jgi:hypothetical protein
VKEKVLNDGVHSMGNRGWLIPPRYLRPSGKCEKTGDPVRWKEKPSMGECCCPPVMWT